MSGRRATAILASLAAASLLGVLAVLFLAGDPGAIAPSPPEDGTPAVRKPDPLPLAGPPGGNGGRPRRPPVLPPEDDRPPTSEMKSVPAGWKPWARLRLLDATTKEALPFGKGRVALLVPRGASHILVPDPWRLAADGRIEVFRSEDERGIPDGIGKAEWEASPVEIRIPGRVPRRFASRAEISGERDLEFAPTPPSIRGTVRLGRGLEGRPVAMFLDPEDPGRDPRTPDAMPSGGSAEAGPFAWYDVPHGRWRLVVRVKMEDGGSASAVREFDTPLPGADLGEIVVLPPTTLRARVVARDGTGVLDTGLSLRRVGAPLEEGIDDDAEDGGWMVFRGLSPDAEYRVVSSLDGLSDTVHTPADGGGNLRVELKWDNEGVRCRLDFTVDGQPPIQWGDIAEGPALDKGAWKKDGRLEHDMAAGEYFFVILARPQGKDAPVRVEARFTVPDQPLWEETIDFKERK